MEVGEVGDDESAVNGEETEAECAFEMVARKAMGALERLRHFWALCEMPEEDSERDHDQDDRNVLDELCGMRWMGRMCGTKWLRMFIE